MFEQPAKKSSALLGSLGLASAVVLLSSVGIGSADAAVAVDADGKVKIFGDVRIRMETDKQTTSGDVDRNRDRTRYRARIGASYQANDAWSGKIRLATTSGQNSPHVTYSTVGNTADLSIGVDTALLAYTGVENLTLVAGKTPLNFWQQTEVFWDKDIHPEAFAAVYQAGPVTLNAAYAMLQDGGWDDDDGVTIKKEELSIENGQPAVVEKEIHGFADITAAIGQLVYNTNLGNMKFTGALGYAKVDDPDNHLKLKSDAHTVVSTQLMGSTWRIGAEYIAGNADQEETAYVIQGRYKINDVFGVRAYFYHVEANATPGDGLFTQDNVPSAQPAADNFEGYRLQLDAKVANNTSIDLRYYDTEAISKGVYKDGNYTYFGQAKSHDRLQLNINVKF